MVKPDNQFRVQNNMQFVPPGRCVTAPSRPCLRAKEVHPSSTMELKPIKYARFILATKVGCWLKPFFLNRPSAYCSSWSDSTAYRFQLALTVLVISSISKYIWRKFSRVRQISIVIHSPIDLSVFRANPYFGFIAWFVRKLQCMQLLDELDVTGNVESRRDSAQQESSSFCHLCVSSKSWGSI